ncbi:unnamed protein product [Cylindrotheca closterium]|uniref:Pseudouridine synthase RsuA/RluA-like domain-containing protein n=1 Tax=Cylindrotheca closterium TaxID=2856 RepID=A0AAD2CF24_9STRA|nr:unnamed protein product [Cylindrotheca closterium]
MGRKKRNPEQNAIDDEKKWKNAVVIPVDGGLSFQVVGVDSTTGTLFARREKVDTILQRPETALCVFSSDGKSPTLFVVLERVLLAATLPEEPVTSYPSTSVEVEAAVKELCRIGAIWITTRDQQHPKNPPKWSRATELQLQQEVMVEDDAIIRMHSRPPRFPSFSKLQVVTKNDTHGFWVVNKPGGCPSHATVDNGVENVLAVVQQDSSYATLPQRLDTETCGLLLVAIRPSFARCMGQLLQAKTKIANQMKSLSGPAQIMESKPMKPLTKKYRCLVVVSDENSKKEVYHRFCRWRDSRHRVIHYLDASSPAPKRFLDTIPGDEANLNESTKWQLCQLQITAVSQPYTVSIPGISSNLSSAEQLYKALWGENQPVVDSNPMYVLQLEIDLLTGRTHQIRGQLSALGAPIVGDALYGGVHNPNNMLLKDSIARASNRMALQCCSLEFKKPTVAEKDETMDEISSDKSSFYRFHLDQAWWTDYLHQYADAET